MYFFHLGHMACLPPSTGNEAPVMKDDSLDARKAITLDTSSTFPGLPKAWVCLQRSRNCTKEQKSFKTKQIRPQSPQYTCVLVFGSGTLERQSGAKLLMTLSKKRPFLLFSNFSALSTPKQHLTPARGGATPLTTSPIPWSTRHTARDDRVLCAMFEL